MPISVRDLLQNDALLETWGQPSLSCDDQCPICGIPLQETVTGRRSGKCSDCYYGEMSAIIEQAPITTPRLH